MVVHICVWYRASARGKNKQDLINAVLNVWTRNSELNDMREVLIASMPDRIKACIKARGRPIHYVMNFSCLLDVCELMFIH